MVKLGLTVYSPSEIAGVSGVFDQFSDELRLVLASKLKSLKVAGQESVNWFPTRAIFNAGRSLAESGAYFQSWKPCAPSSAAKNSAPFAFKGWDHYRPVKNPGKQG